MLIKNLLHDIRTETDVAWMVQAANGGLEAPGWRGYVADRCWGKTTATEGLKSSRPSMRDAVTWPLGVTGDAPGWSADLDRNLGGQD